MSQTIQGRFYARVDHHPARRALGFYSPDGTLDWLSYAELHGQALKAAGWLRDQGVGRGDVCMLVLPSGRTSALLLLGALSRGAIPLVMAPPAVQGSASFQSQVLAQIARRTAAALVVADHTLEAAHEAMGPVRARFRYVDPDGALPTAHPADAVTPRPGDLAAYQLTSGTTGFPRVCVWRQRKVVAALDAMWGAMQLRDDDLCVNWTPLYHDMGLVNNLLLCVTSGLPLVLLSPLEFVQRPAIWLRALSDTRATQTWSPNFGFALATERIRDAELTGVRLDSVRAFWNAAERIHFATIEAFHRRFHALGVAREALKTNFGCAENVGGATFSDPHGPIVCERLDAASLHGKGVAIPASDADTDGTVTVVSAGRPSPGIDVAVLGRNGRPRPEGHVGELALKTPSRMEGYLRDARATARAIRGPYLKTGDLGYLRGGEFFWTGRVKERITIRGRKLDPSDFEPVLLTIDGLRLGCFVAFGVDDARRGTQKVVVAAELKHDKVDGDRVAAEIRERVLRQMGIALADVVLVPRGALTKTTSGKRRHRAHRDMYADGTLNTLRVRSGR